MDRQTKWDIRYLRLAMEVASWSKDPSTKVGAILVRDPEHSTLPGNRVIATGFNGFPEGMDDDPALYANRSYKYKYVVHAEVAAFESLGGVSPKGATLYTSFPCCTGCVERAGREGIVRAVSPPINLKGRSPEWVAEWTSRLAEAFEVAKKWGIKVEVLRV